MNPFTQEKAQSIADWGEVRLIREIAEALGAANPEPPAGIGDDAAVLRPAPDGASPVVTTDALVWARHFDVSVSPGLAGAKLVKRNLSDLAAIGATPDWMTLNLLLAGNVSKKWILGFVSGIRKACLRYRSRLVGGDLAQTGEDTFSSVITAGGSTPFPLLRSGARRGDSLWVTGSLGDSLARGKHLDFEPRLEEGRWLAGKRLPSACIDVTDGLSKDLPTLLPTGTAASLLPDGLPVSPSLKNLPSHQCLEHAFLDGEDYELLFALPKAKSVEEFRDQWKREFPETPISHFGWIVEKETDALFIDQTDGRPFPIQPGGGYQHLNSG